MKDSPHAPKSKSLTRIASAIAVIAVLGVLWAPRSATAATEVAELDKVVASVAAGAYFGGNVAMDGDVMVVAAPQRGYGGTPADEGAAYVFRLSGGAWNEEAVLTAGDDAFVDQAFADNWARTVDVAGGTIVVGASQDDDHGTQSGAAYVFTHSGGAWSSEPQKLSHGDLGAYDRFGMNVAISEDESIILVSAPFSGPQDQGKVYVFERDGTSYVWRQTLAHPGGSDGDFDQFGIDAAIAQDTLVVSAWLDDNANGTDAGTLFVFERNATTGDWEYDEALVGAGSQAGWQLGWDMAISPDANTIAASTAAGLDGGVYVFERTGEDWADRGALPHPVDTGDWLMGDSIALSDDTMVIGHSALASEVGGAHIYRRSGAAWTYSHRLVPSDGDGGDFEASPSNPADWGDWAGTAVAVSGSLIALGAPNHDEGAQQAGAVYVFADPAFGEPSIDLSEQQELVPSSAEVRGSFGSNLAMDGDVMVVGAPNAGLGGSSAGTGAAIVYRRMDGRWSEEAALTAGDDASVGQAFADSWARTVDVAGDTIVVGASQDNDHGTYSGAAYVYTYAGGAWSSVPQKLAHGDLGAYDRFGMNVAISEDESTILVSAPFSGPQDQGKVYVFERDGTSYVWRQTLAHPGGSAGDFDHFGIHAAIAQDTIVVSAWLDDNANGTDAGTLFVFERNATTGDWEYDEALVISGGQAGWLLGWGLAISPDASTIAASTAAGLAGGVYLFERDGASWTDLGELSHPPDPGDWVMGDSIALSDDTMVIGHSAMLEEIGGAYIYRNDGTGWSLAHRLVTRDGGPGDYEANLGSPDGYGDWAGTAVALSGPNIAIGAPNHDDGGPQAGSVYAYRDPGPAPDGDVDGLSDDLEAGFGGPDPDDSLAIHNAETGDVAYAEGTVEDGVTLYSGSYAIAFPPNTSVEGSASQIEITMVSGTTPRVAVSGADLDGGTKSITIPFDPTASNPVVCIDDSPTATVDSVLDAGGCSDGVTVGIPATVGASNTVGTFTVTRLVDARAQVAGLSHTALASFDLGDAPPVVESVGSSVAPVAVDSTVTANATFSDPDDGGAHVAVWDWGDGSTSAGSVDQGANAVSGSHVYEEAGVYKVGVTLTDADGNGASAAAVYEYVVVYDPDGGYATGGGRFDSPAGACAWGECDSTTVGEASFGFVSKYLPGGGGSGSTPSGNTTFHFSAGDLKFKSVIQGWLVIAGQNKAKFMGGTGQINNQGDFGYMVTVVDNGSDGDTFRIKIWDNQDGDGVVYDNKMGTGDDGYDGTEITAGNIKVHKD